jgi:hypothetical protein
MTALMICILAFGLTCWAGRHSLGRGLVVLLVFGYFYGILRANLPTTFSHFIFDSGVIGLYLSQFAFPPRQKIAHRSTTLNFWVLILILWPVILIFMPFQPLLVSLVGFRGVTFFIPMLILGTRLREKDLIEICYGLAALNLIAGGFAAAEFFLGVPRFYPRNPVTELIYHSADVAGTFFRIPATFVNAHAYGGTMVYTLPFLFGFWNRSRNRLVRWLMVLSIGAALLGVLLSAARLSFIMAAVTVIVGLFISRMSAGRRITVIVVLAGLGVIAFGQERLQRFTNLSDTDYIADRVAGSVNRGFWEILAEHPMGNGLGGGGTAMPYFLEGEVRNPIGIENEYGVILAEQGVIGLLLWLGFLAWFATRAPIAFAKGSWDSSRRMGWCLAAFSFGTAWIGTGFLSAIPGTAILLLCMGFAATPPGAEAGTAEGQRAVPVNRYRPVSVPSIY